MDTSSLKYDPSKVPAKSVMIDYYPDLADYEEFSGDDILVRVSYLATDEQSPFVKKDRDDYEKRIKSIFEYLKLTDDKLFRQIVVNNNPEYSAMVNRWFVMQDNLAYTMWQNMLFNFHMIGVALRQPPNMNNLTVEMDKRAKLQAQQSDLHEKLITYEAQIFTDVPTRKIIRKEVAKIIQFPEQMAQSKTAV